VKVVRATLIVNCLLEYYFCSYNLFLSTQRLCKTNLSQYSDVLKVISPSTLGLPTYLYRLRLCIKVHFGGFFAMLFPIQKRLLYHLSYIPIQTQSLTFSYGNLSSVVTLSKAKKGKAIPLLAWTGPEGSRRFRLPDFKTIGT
jgi:hypothetical protein